MKRNVSALAEKEYDLIIIGGGIYGATAAWEAATRGLSVVLIDRGDFACATSSNSHKIVHGGIRYLQQVDIPRIRESIRELHILMKIAPHLVYPMPFLIPLYGHGINGPEVFRIALQLQRMIGWDITREFEKSQRSTGGQIISTGRCIELLPMINNKGLTGAGLWYDGQIYNTERLIISFLESAYSKGACLANYVEMTDFMVSKNSVIGIFALDKLSGKKIEIKSKMAINATGPWVDIILKKFTVKPITLQRKFSSALNLVTKPIVKKFAVAIMSQHEDDENIIRKGGRMFIITPWHNCSLVGTSHQFFDGIPDDFKITKEDVVTFLDEINQAIPTLKLRLDDVLSFHAGLLPQSRKQGSTSDVKVEKKYEIVDHEIRDGVSGLITVVGVKYTTARDVSKNVLDLVCKKLMKRKVSTTHSTPISGGNIRDVHKTLDSLLRNRPLGIEEDICKHLFFSYGSNTDRIIAIVEKDRERGRRVSKNLPVIEAEIIHSLESEMALRLEDVIFRRIELASLGNPGDEVLLNVAEITAKYHRWNRSQVYREIDAVKERFAVLQ